jgi:hypothetical protein
MTHPAATRRAGTILALRPHTGFLCPEESRMSQSDKPERAARQRMHEAILELRRLQALAAVTADHLHGMLTAPETDWAQLDLTDAVLITEQMGQDADGIRMLIESAEAAACGDELPEGELPPLSNLAELISVTDGDVEGGDAEGDELSKDRLH